MLSFASRSIVGLSIWACSISPAGAQSPANSDVADDMTYRFGQQMFVEDAATGGRFYDKLPTLLRDLEFAPLRNEASSSTDGMASGGDDSDFLSDDWE